MQHGSRGSPLSLRGSGDTVESVPGAFWYFSAHEKYIFYKIANGNMATHPNQS